MPANLTPQYHKALQAFREAKTTDEKISCLEYMLAVIPKHKGTTHMQGDLKRQLAQLKEAPTAKAGSRQRDPFHVEPGGGGQVVLMGLPNCGKSALVGALTKARVNVTDYPFGTHAPVPGMAHHEDVPIQLVDMPPITPEALMPGIMGAYRNADIVLILVDLAAPDALEQAEACLTLLRERDFLLVGRHTERYERSDDGLHVKATVLVGTKGDLPGATDTLAVLRELYGSQFPLVAVSTVTGESLNDLLATLFRLLDVIRVYCKEPGKPPDMEMPFILPRESTVVDMARAVHRDLPDKLKYACVWGSSKFPGQQVQRDHTLADRDIVELHTAS
jgi:uncharacterized protein